MAEEVLVLGRNEGLDHVFRHLLDRDEQSPFLGKFGHERAVGGVQPGDHLGLVVLNHFVIRQIMAVAVVHVTTPACEQQEDQHDPQQQGHEQESQGSQGKRDHGALCLRSPLGGSVGRWVSGLLGWFVI